jgi:hypothetical protein
MKINAKDEKLYGLLEKILFNETEFDTLKATIHEVSMGKKPAKILREQIIQEKIRILEDLVEFFHFYVQYSVQHNKQLSSDTSFEEKETLLQKIKEREELLKIIAKKLNQLTNNNGSKENTTNEPFSQDTRYIVIDGANVARDTNYKGSVHNLEILLEKLKEYGIIDYKVLCDSNLVYSIDNQELYSSLLKDKHFVETPGRAEADPFILQFAKEKDAYIISNDLFRDYYDRFSKEWILDKRISFKIIDNNIYFDNLNQ